MRIQLEIVCHEFSSSQSENNIRISIVSNMVERQSQFSSGGGGGLSLAPFIDFPVKFYTKLYFFSINTSGLLYPCPLDQYTAITYLYKI